MRKAERMQKIEEAKRISQRGVSFITLTYPSDDGWDNPQIVADDRGLPCVYIIHDRDKRQLDDGTVIPDKVHCHTLIRTGNPMTISAFAKRFHVETRFVQVCSDWREFALYLVHQDYDSRIDPLKSEYPVDRICGNYRDNALKAIERYKDFYRGKAVDDSEVIVKILDEIQAYDYLPLAILIRWCAEYGYYSTLKRSASLVLQVLKEHNSKAEVQQRRSLYQDKIDELSKRLDEAENQLSEFWGDMFQRVRNEERIERQLIDMNLLNSILKKDS